MSSHAPLVSPCRQRASADTARVQVVLQYLNGAPDLDGSYPYLREIGSLETDGFVMCADKKSGDNDLEKKKKTAQIMRKFKIQAIFGRCESAKYEFFSIFEISKFEISIFSNLFE